MELFTKIITVVNDIVWHPACLFFLGGAAIWFTLRLKGLQFTGLPSMFHYMFEKESDKLGEAKGLSAFQALATTVGGRVGTGNIAGTATAISWGDREPSSGCGWRHCWSIHRNGGVHSGSGYKTKNLGELTGGPYYYMEKGFKNKNSLNF